MPYLVADIGGTHVRFRLIAPSGTGWRTVHEEVCLAAARKDANDAVRGFLASLPAELRGDIHGACLAIAGLVGDGRAAMTNLDWQFDADALAAGFGFGFVELINDFEAVALAVPRLPDDALQCIRAGTARAGPVLAIGPGTGLGQVMFRVTGGTTTVFPSEGGHIAFAPLDERQDRLLAFLRARHARVSYEHLLSGRGLGELHAFLRHEHGLPAPSDGAADAARVVALAHAGDDLARETVELFWSVLGAFAGDAVLASLASGGVYLVGGILPRLPATLGRAAFNKAFEDKGMMSTVVSGVPVRLVMSGDVGLLGAQAGIERRLAGLAENRGR